MVGEWQGNTQLAVALHALQERFMDKEYKLTALQELMEDEKARKRY